MTQEPSTEELMARLERLEAQAAADLGAGDETKKRWGSSGAETALWSLMRTLFPDETRRHMRAATREQLLAARSYIDHWLERLDRNSPEAADPEREHISIE